MGRTTVRAQVGSQDSVRAYLVEAHQWEGPSGGLYDIPETVGVHLGDVELAGRPADVVALLDGALTQVQSMMDAQEEENR